MTKVKNGLIKQLIVLSLVLLTVVAIATPFTGMAGITITNKSFDFDIPAHQGLTHSSESYLRNTSNLQNAWSVNLQYSNETTSAANQLTSSLFWLGINNPNGINPLGSNKMMVNEGSGYNYFSANAAASNKYVFLYASDNADRATSYSVSGKWNPASGHKPSN